MTSLKFFHRLKNSFTTPNALHTMSKESGKYALRYFLTFLLLTGLIIGSISAYIAHNDAQASLEQLRSDAVPDFSLKDGKLTLDLKEAQVSKLEEDTMIVILDPTGTTYSLNDLAGYTQGYLITPERVIISASGAAPMPFEFSNFKELSFTKAELVATFESVMPFFAPLTVLVTFIMILISGFFKALLIAFFANFARAQYRIVLPFKRLFIMSMYAMSVPFFASELIRFIPWSFTYVLVQATVFGFSLFLLIRTFPLIATLEGTIPQNPQN